MIRLSSSRLHSTSFTSVGFNVRGSMSVSSPVVESTSFIGLFHWNQVRSVRSFRLLALLLNSFVKSVNCAFIAARSSPDSTVGPCSSSTGIVRSLQSRADIACLALLVVAVGTGSVCGRGADGDEG